jgi:predicted CXXCH cytochrome family protein
VKYIGDMADWNVHGFRYRPGARLDDDAPVMIRLAKVADDARLPERIRKNPEALHGTFWPDGMVRVSGREYTGLLESACFQRGELSCLSCHSMHKSDPKNQIAKEMDGNQACLQCHEKFRKSLSTHTHHPEKSSGSLCYNCHMPHTTYGLLKAIRSHQISSPNVETTIKTGRPNACNLCHLDKSLGWTSTQLGRWYQAREPRLSSDEQTTSAAVLWVLRGDANQRALLAWHMGWKPALEASGADWVPPYLAQLLKDPYSAVRYVAQRSLKRFPDFAKFEYDYIAPETDRQVAHLKALEIATARAGSRAAKLPVLINADGTWQTNRVNDLLRQRDDRALDLLE